MLVLVGDIGGTKVELALADDSDPRSCLSERARFETRDHENLSSVIDEFLGSRKRPDAAALGVAGTVSQNRATLTNLGWVVDGDDLAKHFSWKSVDVFNDLEVVAHAVPNLDSSDLHCLQKGEEVRGSIGVISLGTGLGQSLVAWDGHRHLPMSSEGGHSSFSPADDDDIALLRFAQKEIGHVSAESLISGQLGLAILCRFYESDFERDDFNRLMQAEVLGQELFRQANEGADAAMKVMLHLVKMFAVECSNLALKGLTTGGIYIGGGMPPKMLEWFERGAFIEHFCRKGRFSEVVEKIPVHVIVSDDVPLRGAALAHSQVICSKH